MKQTTMSLPDLLLQLFVIFMCGWGIYNKWIGPRIGRLANRRKVLPHGSDSLLTQLLTPGQPREMAAPAASTPVTIQQREEPQGSAAVPPPTVDDEEDHVEEMVDDEEEGEEEGEEDLVENLDRFERQDVDPEEDEEEGEEGEENITPTKYPVPTAFPRFVATKKSDPNAAWNAFASGLLGSANHLIVIGASGGGKTVTMYDLVRNLLENSIQVVVCDPDAADGDWPGADMYGGGDDFEAINGVLAGLYELMKERRQLRVQGIREFESMWFVFDEYSDIKDECNLAATVVENGLRRARKLNIHLMIGVQDTQVKTMGFERKSSLLEHARIIKLVKRLDGSRILRLDDETTIKVPKFDIAIPSATTSLSGALSRSPQKFQVLTGGEWDDGSEDGEGDEEVTGDGKEQIIRQLLLCKPPWSYQRIVAHMGTSSARISRIKHKLEDEGLL